MEHLSCLTISINFVTLCEQQYHAPGLAISNHQYENSASALSRMTMCSGNVYKLFWNIRTISSVHVLPEFRESTNGIVNDASEEMVMVVAWPSLAPRNQPEGTNPTDVSFTRPRVPRGGFSENLRLDLSPGSQQRQERTPRRNRSSEKVG